MNFLPPRYLSLFCLLTYFQCFSVNFMTHTRLFLRDLWLLDFYADGSHEKNKVRWWKRWWGGKRYDTSWGSQIKPNYAESNVTFLQSSLALFLLHFPKMLAEAQPMACGYLFMCNLLEGWPLSPFSNKSFTILFMSTCLIQMATHSYKPRVQVSLHAVTEY